MSNRPRAKLDAAKAKRRVDDDAAPAPSGSTLEVRLEHMRYRHLAWMSFGLITGALLVWKLGTVGKWIGLGLIAIGGLAAYSFVRTILFPAGTIVVSDAGVALPRGLCKGEPEKFALADLKHAYLLRRSVPWTRAAPVLVIESKDRAFTYPRDWFITEADQRRIVRELHARGVGQGGSPATAPDAEPDAAGDAKAAGEG